MQTMRAALALSTAQTHLPAQWQSSRFHAKASPSVFRARSLLGRNSRELLALPSKHSSFLP